MNENNNKNNIYIFKTRLCQMLHVAFSMVKWKIVNVLVLETFTLEKQNENTKSIDVNTVMETGFRCLKKQYYLIFSKQ